MALIFVSKQHEETFREALKKARIDYFSNSNKPLQVALYVLSALPSVASKLDTIVNFQHGFLNPDGAKRFDFSMGEKAMVGLAVNLYNGIEMADAPISPHSVMSWIDPGLKRVYLSALEYRFM